MHQLLSILLSAVMTLQSVTVNMEDLFNVGDLLEHVNEHKEEFGDNFFQFLAKHYGTENSHLANHKEHQSSHEDLPFQHGCHIVLVFVLELNKTYISELKEFPSSTQQALYYYNTQTSSVFVSGIFQPPRLAKLV